jgi:uncharacterized protein (TIGR02391 family)
VEQLSTQQLLLLQTIFDHFNREASWPTYREVARELYGLDVEELSKSLPAGFCNAYAPMGQVILTVPALYLCKNSTSILRDFLWLIRLSVEQYFASPEVAPQFSSDMLSERLQMSATSIRKVGLLAQFEPGIYHFFHMDSTSPSWYFEIAHDIRRFQGVTTIDQYLEKRGQLAIAPSTSQAGQQQPQSVTVEAVESLQLHPDIRTHCWDLYSVGNYDNAVLQATKLLEINVRNKARLPLDMVGVDIINQAFGAKNRRLDYGQVEAEQQGVRELLCGMIRVFKNPQSHRFVGMQSKADCLGVLLMCSTLLYIIDNVKYVGPP